MITANLAGHLQRFFTDRLMGQLGASAHTVASYRDTFRLLLHFATKRLQCQPSQLRLGQIDVPFLNAFFKHLEQDRCNRGVPHRRRGGSPPQSSGSRDLDWPPRPSPPAGGPADRVAQCGDHLAPAPGCPIGHGCSRPLPRQGPQAALHAFAPRRGDAPWAMAVGATSRANLAGLFNGSRQRPQPRCPAATGRPTLEIGRAGLPLAQNQTCHAPFAASHAGHGTFAPRGRSDSDCALARSRVNSNHTNLSPCRHCR